MRYSIYTISSFLLLSSCGPITENSKSSESSDSLNQLDRADQQDSILPTSQQDSLGSSREEISEILENNKLIPEVKNGILAMQRGDYESASKSFNSALLDNPGDSYLHFLNGLNYLHKAAAGDAASRDLALTGFRYAIVYDQSNVLAHKRLGYMYYQTKEYARAQQHFAEVLLLQEPNVKALYALAAASYYNRDLKTAYASINKAASMAPDNIFVLKAAAMIAAALNQPLDVQNFRKKYMDVSKKSDGHLDRRLHQWMSVHNNPHLILTSADAGDDSGGDGAGDDDAGADADADADAGGGNDAGGNAKPGGAPDLPGDDALPPSDGTVAATPMAKKLGDFDPKNPDTFVIDCAIMRVSEEGKTSKGSNILDTINVVLNPGTYTGNRTWTNNTGNGNTKAMNFTQSFGLSQPATATYSLNIFNVTDTRIEVVARPTVMAALGKVSEFFAGTDLIANVSSAAAGNSIEKLPIGYRVTVTPIGSRKNKDGVLKIQFDVRVEGNSVGVLYGYTGSNSTATSNYSQINHSSVCTTVELSFGETVILAGLYDREDNMTKSKTPGLGDIPGLGLLFSSETTDSSRKSVVYMMTLRPTEKMQEDANMFNDGRRISPEVLELQMKNISWFNTVPVSAILMKGLSRIYREFRTGDIPNIYWDHQDMGEKKLGEMNNEIGEAVRMMDS